MFNVKLNAEYQSFHLICTRKLKNLNLKIQCYKLQVVSQDRNETYSVNSIKLVLRPLSHDGTLPAWLHDNTILYADDTNIFLLENDIEQLFQKGNHTIGSLKT